MLNTLNINLKTDIKTDRPTALGIKLMSQDKNNNHFILRFTNGGEPVTLDDTYTVEILTKFTNSGASRLTSATVRQDYATWQFDTDYITQDETVYNYVYVRKSGSLVVSADANAFYFDVGLSEIDKGAGRVAEVYDENYQKHLDEFKEVADFTVIQQAEADRESSEATRKTNETTRISNEDARKSAENIRLANEVERVNAENIRAGFYEGFDGRLGDLESGRVVLKNLVVNGDFSNGSTGWKLVNARHDSENNFTFTGGLGYVYQNIPTRADDKIYIVYNAALLTEGGTLSVRLAASTREYDFPTAQQVVLARYDESMVGSVVVNVRDNYEIISFSSYPSPGASRSVELNLLQVINLTQIFGAGNEPTKAEMDELIKITGYIEEVTSTQILTWQLKLMRQNRNALIALGGTII